MTPGPSTPVRIDAPATIGNFGPGFDTISLALANLGDTIHLEPANQDQLTLQGPHTETLPTAWDANTATATLTWLRNHTDDDQPLHIRIEKQQPPGSGLGSSASSAAGAALAYHALYPQHNLTPETLVQAAAAGEAAANNEHYDDVASATLGGLAIVQHETNLHLQRIQPPTDLHLALLRPTHPLETNQMRRVLPTHVALTDAVTTLGNLATLIDAFHREDIPTIGRCLDDKLAAPHRQQHIPFYTPTARAAINTGAYGATLAGSGPSIVAVTDDPKQARTIAATMQETATDLGHDAQALTATPETRVMHREATMR